MDSDARRGRGDVSRFVEVSKWSRAARGIGSVAVQVQRARWRGHGGTGGEGRC